MRGCLALKDIVLRLPRDTVDCPSPSFGGTFSGLAGSRTMARRPMSSIETMTGNISGYTIRRRASGECVMKMSTRLNTSKSRSKSMVDTSRPKRMAKQIVQMPGVFHQYFSLCFIRMNPPLLSANFLTYGEPLATKRRARILAAKTTTRWSGSARR